ncbi:MAG: hypothetical protein RLZZ490_33, partial [Cyanobacteriota bacterium]
MRLSCPSPLPLTDVTMIVQSVSPGIPFVGLWS